jgi:hypothetical protein
MNRTFVRPALNNQRILVRRAQCLLHEIVHGNSSSTPDGDPGLRTSIDDEDTVPALIRYVTDQLPSLIHSLANPPPEMADHFHPARRRGVNDNPFAPRRFSIVFETSIRDDVLPALHILAAFHRRCLEGGDARNKIRTELRSSAFRDPALAVLVPLVLYIDELDFLLRTTLHESDTIITPNLQLNTARSTSLMRRLPPGVIAHHITPHLFQ